MRQQVSFLTTSQFEFHCGWYMRKVSQEVVVQGQATVIQVAESLRRKDFLRKKRSGCEIQMSSVLCHSSIVSSAWTGAHTLPAWVSRKSKKTIENFMTQWMMSISCKQKTFMTVHVLFKLCAHMPHCACGTIGGKKFNCEGSAKPLS